MIPIRTEIEVLPADEVAEADEQVIITSKGKVQTNPNKPLVLGWKVKEIIGVAVVNPRGVARGRKSVVIGD